jgi:hypothetical protein
MQHPNLSTLGCFEVYRILRSFLVFYFAVPSSRNAFFFLIRRDHFKAALAGAGVPAAFTFLPFSCIWPARASLLLFLIERIAQNHPDATELTRDLPIY